MRPIVSCLLLFALAGCNRHRAADVTLDADAAQRNATAAKTLADIAAAEEASRGAPPAVHDAASPRPDASPAGEQITDDDVTADSDEQDAQGNE